MVYGFLLADAVDPRHFVIREGQGGSSSAMLQKWEENPAEMVSELIRRDIEASGLFQKAVDQWSTVRHRYALEGKINTLHAVASRGKAKIQMEVEATLIDFEQRPGRGKTLMKKDYKIEVPSADTSSSSIARAINLAVKQLSERVRSDIRESLTPSGESGDDRQELWRPELPVRLSLGNLM
ncbi:MAG: membrane integrity-associated transporter subunit PqiC [Deltaproteobacteria bacterium]|nr:membrane integrity-associated transporter subunit PqiC [Deltaproteobacteria bacterium]